MQYKKTPVAKIIQMAKNYKGGNSVNSDFSIKVMNIPEHFKEKRKDELIKKRIVKIIENIENYLIIEGYKENLK